MDWNAPQPLTIAADTGAMQKLLIFLGAYDCRVYFSDDVYLDVGAGSLAALHNIGSINYGATGLIGTIGRFCEFNATAEILAGGEHRHDRAVNITFTALPLVPFEVGARNIKPSAPFRIGSNVVISKRAILRPGLSIGDGAVIGVGSIVTRDVEPFSIVGGSPARTIGEREPCLNWWDFSTAYLHAIVENSQAVVAGPGPHEWRPVQPRWAIRKVSEIEFEILGFVVDERLHRLEEAPAKVRAYLEQAFGPKPSYWLADCWA